MFFLGFHSNVDALCVWDPVLDRTVFALSVRILAGRTFANFPASLPGTGLLPDDAVTPLLLDTSSVSSPPSSTPDSPPIFGCNLPDCSACALDAAYLAVLRSQPRMDTQLYASHDSCAVCETGGNLVCCDFCDVVFHATCVPALRPHLPPAGLVCVECFTETFPAQRDAYDRLFYQRPLTLPLSATIGPPLGSSVEPFVVSPLLDASLTFSQRILPVPVPPVADPSPTPRDLRASRRSAIVARTSSTGKNARDSMDESARVATVICACTAAGAQSSCAGTTATVVSSIAAGEAANVLPDARVSTDAPVHVTADIDASTDAGAQSSYAGTAAPLVPHMAAG